MDPVPSPLQAAANAQQRRMQHPSGTTGSTPSYGGAHQSHAYGTQDTAGHQQFFNPAVMTGMDAHSRNMSMDSAGSSSHYMHLPPIAGSYGSHASTGATTAAGTDASHHSYDGQHRSPRMVGHSPQMYGGAAGTAAAGSHPYGQNAYASQYGQSYQQPGYYGHHGQPHLGAHQQHQYGAHTGYAGAQQHPYGHQQAAHHAGAYGHYPQVGAGMHNVGTIGQTGAAPATASPAAAVTAPAATTARAETTSSAGPSRSKGTKKAAKEKEAKAPAAAEKPAKGSAKSKRAAPYEVPAPAPAAAPAKKAKKEKEEKPAKPAVLRSKLKPPKQAPSAWQVYFTEELQKMKVSQPGERLNVAHVAKDAGQRYAALPDSAKKRFQERSLELKAEWEKDMEAWRETLTPEDIKQENAFRTAQRKAGKSRKGNLKDPHAPKKPLSAYFLFLRAIRADPAMMQQVFEGESETTKQSVLAAAKWRSLSETEKQPYLERADADKAEYERQRREYETTHGIEPAAKTKRGGGNKRASTASSGDDDDDEHGMHGMADPSDFKIDGFGDGFSEEPFKVDA